MSRIRTSGIIFLLSVFLLITASLHAQPTGDPTGDPDTPPVEEVPVDGGLSLLLGAGIAYGTRRAYLSRKRK